LKQIKKLGSMDSILSMVPGFSALKQKKDIKVDENELVRIEAIINSMTRKERKDPSVLNASRRKRIANGSGTRVQEVNKFMNQYKDMRKMMKKFRKSGTKGLKGMLQNFTQ
jgi:signal recognition particle subunit SRP54